MTVHLVDDALLDTAQAAAEKHLNACADALFDAEEGEGTGESPSIGPYCGCETCVVREVLAAAFLYLGLMKDWR